MRPEMGPGFQSGAATMVILPRLYAILDTPLFPEDAALFMAAEELVAGGAPLLQNRNKSDNARHRLEQARELKRRLGSSVKLIMNDRADLCIAAGFDGEQVGVDDDSTEGGRNVVGQRL